MLLYIRPHIAMLAEHIPIVLYRIHRLTLAAEQKNCGDLEAAIVANNQVKVGYDMRPLS